jgi:hypothetical protein
MSEAHSKNSASKFEAEMLCPGRRAMTEGAPRSASRHAAWGTVAHGVADDCLRNSANPEGFVGRVVQQDGFSIAVDDEMAECVRTYIDNVRDMAGGYPILPESRVCYSDALGTKPADSWGTADAIVLRGNELQTHDLKTGRGVEVDAAENTQMRLYALGALQLLDGLTGSDGIENVRMVIHQPRIRRAPSEYVETAAALRAWGSGEARRALGEIEGAVAMQKVMKVHDWRAVYLRPNEKSCRFCDAKATCPALSAFVTESVKPSTVADPEEFA